MTKVSDSKSLLPPHNKSLILSFNSILLEYVKMEVYYDDPCRTIIEEEMKKVEILYEGTMKGDIYYMFY